MLLVVDVSSEVSLVTEVSLLSLEVDGLAGAPQLEATKANKIIGNLIKDFFIDTTSPSNNINYIIPRTLNNSILSKERTPYIIFKAFLFIQNNRVPIGFYCRTADEYGARVNLVPFSLGDTLEVLISSVILLPLTSIVTSTSEKL